MSGEHIKESLLEQYAIDTLPQDTRAGVDEHLLGCPDCQHRLVEVDGFLDALRPAMREVQRERAAGHRSFHLLPRLVWQISFAALAAALLLFVILRPGEHPIAAAVIQMRALRGPEIAAQLTTGQAALLVFDVAGQTPSAKYAVQVVDQSGKTVSTVTAEAKEGKLSALVPRLHAAAYWVRLYREPEKSLMEEYGLRIVEPSGVPR